MKKVSLRPDDALNLIAFSPILLVSSAYDDARNVITVSWSSPVSFNPPILSIMIGHAQFSHQLIENSREFVINVPDSQLLEQIKFCGTHSGRNCDKFLEARLTASRSLSVSPPSIWECFANIECQIYRSFEVGDHTIFCGSVVAVLAEEGVMLGDGRINLEKRQPLLQFGNDHFCHLGKVL